MNIAYPFHELVDSLPIFCAPLWLQGNSGNPITATTGSHIHITSARAHTHITVAYPCPAVAGTRTHLSVSYVCVHKLVVVVLSLPLAIDISVHVLFEYIRHACDCEGKTQQRNTHVWVSIVSERAGIWHDIFTHSLAAFASSYHSLFSHFCLFMSFINTKYKMIK